MWYVGIPIRKGEWVMSELVGHVDFNKERLKNMTEKELNVVEKEMRVYIQSLDAELLIMDIEDEQVKKDMDSKLEKTRKEVNQSTDSYEEKMAKYARLIDELETIVN